MTKNTVMIVDDLESQRKIIEAMLSPTYELMLLSSAQECLTALEDKKIPDVILLDVNMPEINGLQLCTRIREIMGTRTIPIIFVSSSGTREDRNIGFDVGADEYINKPINPKELLNKIEYQLSIIRLG